MPTQQPINVDVTKLEMQICPKCECPTCHEVFQLRHLPALMSPNGQAQLVKIAIGFACNNCNASMFEQPEPEEKKPLLDIVN